MQCGFKSRHGHHQFSVLVAESVYATDLNPVHLFWCAGSMPAQDTRHNHGFEFHQQLAG